MFVSKHNDELWLVNQYDHSIQAGEVASKWGNDEFAAPSKSLITAVEKHDIGWIGPDEEVYYDEETGRPVNFININLKQHVALYSNGYKQILEEDPYAGMIIGMHWVGLYTSRFGYDPTFTYKVPEDLKTFIEKTISETQKEWIDVKMKYWKYNERRSKFEDQIWMDYEFMQIMDRFSQEITINRPEDKVENTVGPIRKSLDAEDTYITITQPGDGTVVVDPFPFKEEFETSVKVRKIKDKRYESHEELSKAIADAPYEIVKWKYVKKA